MAAVDDDGRYIRRLVQALQVLRGANALEVRGPWASQEEARAVVIDFVQVFDVDAVITELEDGFRVELKGESERTIRLDF
jgi:hypothetical protein